MPLDPAIEGLLLTSARAPARCSPL